MARKGKPAQDKILERYKKQSHRGTEGFGYVALDKSGNLQEYKRTQTETGIKKALKESDSEHILFHHRYPTSTVNVPEGAHPILVRNKELKNTYYVVHNGVISNPDVLRDEHLTQGYKYTTEIVSQYRTAKGRTYDGGVAFNDSEALAIELARTIEGLQPEVRAKGSIATIVFQMNKAGTKCLAVFYGTNGGNPLTITDTKDAFCIASEGGKAVPANKMYCIDQVTGETSTVYVPMPEHYSYTAGYGAHGGYVNYPSNYDWEDELDTEDGGAVPEFTEADTNLWGNDTAIKSIVDTIEDIESDLEIARQAGEQEEIEDLMIELEGVRGDLAVALQNKEQAVIGF